MKASPYTTRLDQAAEEAYIPTANTSLQAATDECIRELHVRLRIYPGWCSKGTMSRTDAEDRGQRLETAIVLLQWLTNNLTDYASKKLSAEQFAESGLALMEGM